ncbi:hypothetical protein ZEAMMB73_Zm00001d019440 [Zea mays]|jgi:hypothetical protein|uniref:Uncharacterized protein n=1 Tax=Zea mays TaxID=4577 RepID=A0A1D6HXF8_MAIZE|nr:hypothetical protein ZEAMMB73_Zm00001d019440 [Zea mays]
MATASSQTFSSRRPKGLLGLPYLSIPVLLLSLPSDQHAPSAPPPHPLRSVRPLPNRAPTLPRRHHASRFPPLGPGLPTVALPHLPLPCSPPTLRLDRLYTLLSSIHTRPDARHPEWCQRDALVASILVADHLYHFGFNVALVLLVEIHSCGDGDGDGFGVGLRHVMGQAGFSGVRKQRSTWTQVTKKYN